MYIIRNEILMLFIASFQYFHDVKISDSVRIQTDNLWIFKLLKYISGWWW